MLIEFNFGIWLNFSLIDAIPNTAKVYYENNKERLREQAKDKYKNLSEEVKNKKREYGKKNRYHSMSKEKKQRLKEYQKNHRDVKKYRYNNE